MTLAGTIATIEGYPAELLTGFICEFNVIRRHVATYPSNHPIIDTCARKVVSLLDQLISGHPDLTLGITRNALMLGSGVLDRKNLIFRDLAGYFFSLGVASLTFFPGLSRQELLRFCELTGSRRETVEAAGLADKVVAAGIRGITVRMVRFDALRATEGITSEEDAPGRPLWEKFIAGLMRDLPPSSTGEPPEGAPPMQVAEYLNRRMAVIPSGERALYSRSIAAFIRSVDLQVAGLSRDQVLERWQDFVGKLAPEVQSEVLREIFPELPSKPLEDAEPWETGWELDEAQVGSVAGRFTEEDREGLDAADLTDRLVQLVFREDFLDQDLETAVARRPSIPPRLISGESDMLRETVAERQVLRQYAGAILALRRIADDEAVSELLERRLEELCRTLMRQGEFAVLMQIVTELAQGGDAESSLFQRADVLEEVLNGLRIWGRDKFAEIAALIDAVGEPFTYPIFTRLATEENPLICRYYLERLNSIGPPARQAALSRLLDERWQLVMYLIIFLRSCSDPKTIQEVRLLAGHQNLRVRMEVLKTLIQCGDPEGEQRLIKEMDSVRSDIQVAAVGLAGESSNPRVLRKLRALLDHPAFTRPGYALKEAIIDSLARIGNPAVLPDLERLLKSRSLLCHGLLKSLKRKAARSLRQYPEGAVSQRLRGLAADLLRGEGQKR